MSDQTVEVKQSDDVEKSEPTRNRRVFLPRADIIETSEQYQIIADVPGADESSVNISLDKNVLTIEAKNASVRPEGFTVVLSEFGVGDYARRFVISDQIDREKIEASVKNGVLSLTLPKAGPEKSQTIKINVN
jgi:HSP20 family protein